MPTLSPYIPMQGRDFAADIERLERGLKPQTKRQPFAKRDCGRDRRTTRRQAIQRKAMWLNS